MSIAAQCPGCGAAIAFHVASSMVAVCDHCNTVSARTDRAIEDLGKTADLVATRSPLALWLAGRYRGVGFQLTGRAQLRHGSGGLWDEWYLAFDDGAWGWLAEAQGRFYLTFRRPTAGAVDPRAVAPGAAIQVDNPPVVAVVAEVGEAEMLAAQGEIPYRLELGRRYRYADVSGPGGLFGTLDFGESPPALFLGREVTLDDLGISRAAPGPGDPGASAGPRVNVAGLTCDNCGGALELHAPDRTERVACPYCGALHDCDRGVLALVSAARHAPAPHDIPLASEGRFEGETFTVIGFMVRQTRSGGVVYPWSEYLLYNPRAGFRWLTCSDGHWSYLTPVPAGAVKARAPGKKLWAGAFAEYGDEKYKVFQTGTAEVRHVAGEFYWKVEAGETAETADYVRPPRMLSGETSGSEINWSLGRYMTRRELKACFPGLSIPAGSPRTIAPNQPFRHKSVYPVWGVLLVLAVVALLWARAAHRPVKVMSQLFDLPARAPGSEGGEVFFTEPFELAGGKNVEVDGVGVKVDNSWMYVQGDLYHQATGAVRTFDLPIEYYHGSDGGESWTEGSRDHSRYFSAMPAGTYVVRVAVERSDERLHNALYFTVSQDVFRLRYWVVAVLLLSLVPIGVIAGHIVHEHRRWRESDYSVGDS